MVLSGLFFGGVWIFSKMIVQDISPLTFTTLRMIAASIILFIFGYMYISQLFSISKQDRWKISIASLVWMMWMAICFTLLVKRTTVINSSFLFFLPAAFLPIFWAIFNNLKIRYTTYIAVLLSIIWLYFLFSPDIVGTSMIGNIFGLLAGICNVIYILSAKKLSHLPPRLLSIAVFSVLVISLVSLTLMVEWNQIWDIAIWSRRILSYIWLCIAWAYFFLNNALQHLSWYLTSILAIREPLAATALWVIFLWEILTTSAMLWLWAILFWFGLISLDKELMK